LYTTAINKYQITEMYTSDLVTAVNRWTQTTEANMKQPSTSLITSVNQLITNLYNKQQQVKQFIRDSELKYTRTTA